MVSLVLGLSLMLVQICKILMNTRALSHIPLGSHAFVAAELLDYIAAQIIRGFLHVAVEESVSRAQVRTLRLVRANETF